MAKFQPISELSLAKVMKFQPISELLLVKVIKFKPIREPQQSTNQRAVAGLDASAST